MSTVTQSMFRFGGDLEFDLTWEPFPGTVMDVRLKPYSRRVSFLQFLRPLTPEKPYFLAQIRSLGPTSVVTIGIAGSDIPLDVHPGHWNNTVGYQSHTGKCYTSHNYSGNTDGEKFGMGDVFGVLVTHFDKQSSTVVFIKNGLPIGTRYHYQAKHSEFFPTIALENGAIDIGMLWPPAVLKPPALSMGNMNHWIKASNIQYDAMKETFYYEDTEKYAFCSMQSSVALSKDIQHFDVVVREVNEKGHGPTIALVTCSSLMLYPTCGLMVDYLKWSNETTDLKLEVGQRIGWGVHYGPESQEKNVTFDETALQPVLCYVTLDTTVIYCKIMLQPPGGFFPLVTLKPYASKVKIDMTFNPRPKGVENLDQLYAERLQGAMEELKKSFDLTSIPMKWLRISEDLQVTVTDYVTLLKYPKEPKGMGVIQLQQSLNRQYNYYSITVNKLDADSVVCLGVAGADFPLNKMPGKLPGSVGWQSKYGCLLSEGSAHGNSIGERFQTGDTVGIQITSFSEKACVVLFIKNYRPVGTRYLFSKDLNQLYPTVAVFGNKHEVDLNIFWQNQTSVGLFPVTKIDSWIIPVGARIVDSEENVIEVTTDTNDILSLQAPYGLSRTYNHFEVQIIEDFSDEVPPPMIALTTASPLLPPPESNFRQDFIRFWATGAASSAIKKGDKVGWGVMFPDKELQDNNKDELVICYLTINRDIALTRVMFNPPGGFHPLVVIPPRLHRVKLDFSCTVIIDHPFTDESIRTLIGEAKRLLAEEEELKSAGKDIGDWQKDKMRYIKGVPHAKNEQEKAQEEELCGDDKTDLHSNTPGVDNESGEINSTDEVSQSSGNAEETCEDIKKNKKNKSRTCAIL
ncbi:uncharacterized protein LOC106151578 [Lingula anatina]|uniref:Uncharacterized protein LOC106151578 n=1 Tax=Lingula anatina TaxID=7574 RepID=A0A1S3H5F9_LINAN|nr:uncharacterized protein LOC106151578 [Lingula anatina]|eukprot:XP_013380369.1 uncharacterized protein LOC106151578 [Lingula anatina]